MLISDTLPDIHEWSKYNPYESQYYKFEPFIVAAGHKIVEVYQTFCTARNSLTYLDVENYGELISKHDEIHLAFIRSSFIQNALVFYNICIDLSWQVIWLFYDNSGYDLIYKNRYMESSKECDFKSLTVRLSYMRSLADTAMDKDNIIMLNDHMVKFFNNILALKVRNKYNYLKHRGAYYYDGLGMNDSNLGFVVNGFTPKMITREELDINDWVDTLISFDILFKEYFEFIIWHIMPEEYLNPSFNFIDPINYHFKIQEYLGKSPN